MEFRVLGLLEVTDNGQPVEIGRGKESALLAALLVSANQPLSSDRLIDDLWEKRPPENAAKTVQIYVSRLRGRLGRDRIETTKAGYLLRVEPGELDSWRFEQLAAEGRAELEAGNPARGEAALSSALDLWRGEPFADFRFDTFAQAEIRRLEELHSSAVADRVDARLALGRADELLPELEALVRDQPFRERHRRQLMLALYHAGRQADALDVYQATRSLLAGELGLDPSPELQALERAILSQSPEVGKPPRAPAAGPPEGVDDAGDSSQGAFVGRAGELGALLAGLEDALAGRGRLFLLVGEPGIGKSRLADELMRHARARGARVLVGRCWEAGGAPAYWPWVQSLRAYVREAGREFLQAQLGPGAAELAQLLPELREHFADLPEPLPGDPEAARFRLFDATTEFLRAVSGSRPVVLVLDDLHAADEPSMLLLQFLARQLGSMRVLVVGAYRDVDPVPDRRLTGLQAELVREPVTRRLLLRGLSAEDVAVYVESAAAELASPELVAALYGETEGNPLFVAETVRLLALEGLQQERAGTTIAIPQGVRDVIGRRLGHLSEACHRLLTVAAVLGREFELAALARLADASDDRVFAAIDEATTARVVSDLPGSRDRRRFAHVLIRDTLYDGLTTPRRVSLHRRAAETLELLYGDEPGQHLAELAHHSLAGRDFEKGVEHARRAGDRALALLAYEEAARLYETALTAVERSHAGADETRCELLLSLGEAEARAGNSPVAKERFIEAADLARRLGLATELGRAAAGYGGRIVWVRAGGDDRLVPLLEEGLAALGEGDVELRARLLARLAGALRDEPSRERRDALSAEAVELARRIADPNVIAYALAGRAHAILAPDTMGECLALGSELLEVAEQGGDREQVVAAHMLRNLAHLMIGDVREAEIDLAAATRVAEELGQPVQLWLVCAAQGMLAIARGDLAEADKLIARAVALGERALPEGAISHDRLQRYTLCDFRGGLETIEAAIRDLVFENPARPVFRCALVHLQARLGRLPEAKRALEELVGENGAALPFDQEWLYGMSLLAETAALAGDVDSAEVLYRQLVPWEAFNAADVAEGIRGSVSRYLGDLAAMMGHPAEAQRHFEAALAVNAEMGMRPWLAQAQEGLARLLFDRGEPGDHERAGELLDEALATYRELGMEAYERRASGAARSD